MRRPAKIDNAVKKRFARAHGNQERAIEWAKKLEKEHSCTKYAIHNPCTKVYQLVEELKNPEEVWIKINE